MIAARITEIVLSMIYNRIIPIRYIDRSVRTDFRIHWSKVRVLRFDYRLENISAIARPIFDEFVTHHGPAFESTGQKLTLDLIGEMGTGHQITAALFFRSDKRRYPRSLFRSSRSGSQIHDARIIHHK